MDDVITDNSSHIMPTDFPSYFLTMAGMIMKRILNCILCGIKKVL